VKTALITLALLILAGKTLAETGSLRWPDVIVIGEEHGNPDYRKIILESLPDFVDAGYKTFAYENSIDLQPKVEEYIQAVVSFDNKKKTKTIWDIAAAMVGRSLPKNSSALRRVQMPGSDRLEATLQPLVDAHIAGLDVRLVDLDTPRMIGYMRHSDARGADRDQAIAGLYSTLVARNRHMAENVQSKTILLVGRAHTGKDENTVEYFLRQKGLSCISIDLVGMDRGQYPPSSEDADYSASPSQLAASGGMVSFLKSNMPIPRADEEPQETPDSPGTQAAQMSLHSKDTRKPPVTQD